MRKIAVVTGNRAEFGLLKNVIQKIEASKKLQLQLFVTGAHLSKNTGLTVEEIEAENLPITEKIPIEIRDSIDAITNGMGEVIQKFGKAFNQHKPDVVVVLGDRYETFAVAVAAVANHIPLAHIHGGEISEGSIDNQWRHAITKLANLHYCATEEFRKRIIQMGEQAHFVYNTGALGIENLQLSNLLSKDDLEQSLAFKLRERNLLFTYHPETSYTKETIQKHISTILSVLSSVEDAGIVLTYPNADLGHEIIINELKKFQNKEAERCLLVESLGAKRYLSLLKYADLVVGNSSSGLIEVPSFRIGTINIGNRQNGRLAPPSIIHTNYEAENIRAAIERGLSQEFRASISSLKNPYDGGIASDLIIESLENISLKDIIFKKFNDIAFNYE